LPNRPGGNPFQGPGLKTSQGVGEKGHHLDQPKEPHQYIRKKMTQEEPPRAPKMGKKKRGPNNKPAPYKKEELVKKPRNVS